jgi:hypothetical protein
MSLLPITGRITIFKSVTVTGRLMIFKSAKSNGLIQMTVIVVPMSPVMAVHAGAAIGLA